MFTKMMHTLIVLNLLACSDASPDFEKDTRSLDQSGISSSGNNPVADNPAMTPSEDMVTPPTQITGAYLKAEMIAESDGNPAQASFGINAFINKQRVSLDEARYRKRFALISKNDFDTRVSLAVSSNLDWDAKVEIKGTSLARVKEQYEKVFVTIRILDSVTQETIEMRVSLAEAAFPL